jgi:hypothetical protein
VDDALDETLTARQNVERRTLWTREEVFEMLRLQRRDDAAVIRSCEHVACSRQAQEHLARHIDPTTQEADHG